MNNFIVENMEGQVPFSSNDRAWFYIDSATNTQRGPVPTAVLVRLLDKGVIGNGATTMAWKEGMEGWKPLLEVSDIVYNI